MERGWKLGPLTVARFRWRGVWFWYLSLFGEPVYDGLLREMLKETR